MFFVSKIDIVRKAMRYAVPQLLKRMPVRRIFHQQAGNFARKGVGGQQKRTQPRPEYPFHIPDVHRYGQDACTPNALLRPQCSLRRSDLRTIISFYNSVTFSLSPFIHSSYPVFA